MFISSLYVKEFRLFHDDTLKLGRYITAIAGFNATGKSTILALLGHCGEVKKFKPFLHSAFRAELSEILKFSGDHDKKIRDIGTINFKDVPNFGVYPTTLSYRSTWQKSTKETRYRIIPKRTAVWSSSSKIKWPTLYLGLARLYPLGESVNIAKTRPSGTVSNEDIDFVVSNEESILSLNERPKDFTTASISETNKKKAIGLNTDRYDYLCNSAGQDNLGQILMSILSFKRLKTQLGNEWCGGLLVVDEIDAALHPLAQNKLVDFLYNQAKDIGLQVVFTTHSLGLLDHISTKTKYNTDVVNNYELVYLTNANGPIVQVVQNPSFDTIFRDLMATYSTPYSRKVSVFSEDDEARFLIGKLLETHASRFNLLDVSLGYGELLRLLTTDFNNFSQFVYVLDGDVTDAQIEQYAKKIAPLQPRCVIKLPGSKRPEQLFWDYISNMPEDHEFLSFGFRLGYTKRSLAEHGPLSVDYSAFTDKRDKYKQWFRSNPLLIDHVFVFWLKDNEAPAKAFVAEFIRAYNWVAQRSFIPDIVLN